MLQNLNFALAGVMPAAVKTGLFVSRCSIYKQTDVSSGSGAATGDYTVPVIENVGCMNAVERENSFASGQTRNVPQVESKGVRHVLLSGPYYDRLFPILEEGLRALVVDPEDSTFYTVVAVEPDSQNRMTRLKLEVVSV